MDAQLLAIVAEGQRGRAYLTPTTEQDRVARSAAPTWGPDEKMPVNPRWFSPPDYGMTSYRDLFTRRQLVALTTFSDLVVEARARVLVDAATAGFPDGRVRLAEGGTGAAAYADAVATYLGFAVDKASNRNCSLCIWEVGMGRLVAAFGRQALPMTWDFAETNPLAGAGGDIRGTAESVAEVVDRLGVGPAGSSIQRDAAAGGPTEAKAAVCTDPPYYDNIGYADLSDFFYVWLRRSLAEIFPDLFSTLVTPKTAELVATPYRFGGDKKAAEKHFEAGLGEAFARMRASADPSAPVTIFYAFKQSESVDRRDGASVVSTGWETMLEAVLEAGLSVDGTWPMRTEQGSGLRVIGQNALASSIVLVCRPRLADAGITTRKDLVGALKREMPEALRTLQHGNIAPVDLAQSSIGPGMAVFSRYARVLEPDGSAMGVRTALALINQVLDEILAEQEGEFDADTRWAIAWYEQFGLAEAAYGAAETLSRAKNTSVEGLVEAGIVAAARGRVRLLARDQYSADWDPAKDRRVPVWEATQRLVHGLLTDGEAAAGDLLARLGGLGTTARDLAYRMYHVAERKGWTDEARAYNALVVAWTDLARGAQAIQSAQPAQASLGLE
jgi:putative DNA methylase